MFITSIYANERNNRNCFLRCFFGIMKTVSGRLYIYFTGQELCNIAHLIRAILQIVRVLFCVSLVAISGKRKTGTRSFRLRLFKNYLNKYLYLTDFMLAIFTIHMI